MQDKDALIENASETESNSKIAKYLLEDSLFLKLNQILKLLNLY